MKLVGMMSCRSESWILGFSARVALQWCDELVILDHASTDDSGRIFYELAKEFPHRVLIVRRDNPDWAEMEMRQAMLELARAEQATHVAIVDCDEVVSANLLPSIRSMVQGCRGHILQLPLYNLRGGIGTYHANGMWGNRIVSVAFADDPRLGWKGDMFHAREPVGAPLVPFRPVEQGAGGVMHYWGSSERRLRAKHALYKVTERLRWPLKPVDMIERMYSMCVRGHQPGEERDWTYNSVPWEWTGEQYLALMAKHLHNDAEPWQEAEVRRLVAEHGHEKFSGLDLFGLVL